LVKLSLTGSYEMRDSWLNLRPLVASASGLVGKMHASAQRLQATHTSSRMIRAPEVGSMRRALTGQTYRHSAVGHCRQGCWWNCPRSGYCACTAGSTFVFGSL